jgi:anti-sigma B factor antagonist
MSVLEQLAQRARATSHRFVLVQDGVQAAPLVARLTERGLGPVVVVGADGIHPSNDPKLAEIAGALRERWPERVRDGIHALDLAAEPLLYAAGLLVVGQADVLLAGPAYPLDQVEDAYRWVLGSDRARSGRGSIRYVAAADDRLITTATPDTAGPLDPKGLAQIAVLAANHRRQAVGDQPRVAFLVLPPTQDASHSDMALALSELQAIAPGIAASIEWSTEASPTAHDPRLRARPNVLIFPIRFPVISPTPWCATRPRRGSGVRCSPASAGRLPDTVMAQCWRTSWPSPPWRRPVSEPRDGGDPMGFSRTTAGHGVTVVRVEGQLIVGNRQELKALIQEALDAGERKFLIDCSTTAYIDSSGLGALVTVSKKVREVGGELRIAGLNDDLRSLFELTKLDSLFHISPTVDQALAEF